MSSGLRGNSRMPRLGEVEGPLCHPREGCQQALADTYTGCPVSWSTVTQSVPISVGSVSL